MEIFVNQRCLLDQLLFRKTGGELGLQRIEGIFALMLHRTAGGDGVSLVVKLPNDGLTQLFVIHLVAIGPFHVLAQLLRKLDLYGTMFLDLFVSELDSSEHHLLGHLLHLALDHQNIVDGTADHDVQIGVLHLREGRVDDVLTADTGHTHLRNRTAERDVRNGQCSRCGQSGQSIGLNIFVRRNQVYGHIYLGVIVRRKQGTQRTVDQTGYEDLAVVSLALTLHEAAGIATASGIFLLILHLERHKIGVGFRVLGGYHRSQEHRISHLHHDGAVGLLGQFARFDHDFAAVCQRDRLPDCIVQLLFFHRYFLRQNVCSKLQMGLPKETLANPIFLPPGLFTEIERLDDCSVALDIDLFQILQQLAALADQTQQRTLCTEVVFVATKVFRKVVDTEREQRDLALGRTRVGVGLSVLTEKLLLFFS